MQSLILYTTAISPNQVGRQVKNAGMFAVSEAYNGGVLQAICAAYFAFAGTRRRANKSRASLLDIFEIFWFLMDTHFERRDMIEKDRLLQSWKMATSGHIDTWSETRVLLEEPNLREYLCCLIWTFTNFSARHPEQTTVTYYYSFPCVSVIRLVV